MQSNLINSKISKNNILTLEKYRNIKISNEYLLYADNILEGITILNCLTENDHYLKFFGVLYHPVDQPIYVFTNNENMFFSIKICGAYEKWELPKDVDKIRNYIDLPDYILYSIKNKRVVVAGENTETASVGNSQWQREGRKIGAAKLGVPFIYQTFYSGRDESQDTIREPNSLQAFNHLIYSIRYKSPSFVAYLENDFEKSQTRKRVGINGRDLLDNYIKILILYDINNSKYIKDKKEIEKEFFMHMINYLLEPKYKDLDKPNNKPRLLLDLPILNAEYANSLLFGTNDFIDNIIAYIYSDDEIYCKELLEKIDILKLDTTKLSTWAGYNNKKYISDFIHYLNKNNCIPTSYISGQSKVGFCSTKIANNYLCNKFNDYQDIINDVIDDNKYKDSIIMPLRIHKKSNGKLTYSPDPESGEIVAFAELFSMNLKGETIRPVIGYCFVDTPDGFNINNKKGTKLYKALANYVDLLIINNKVVLGKFDNINNYDNSIPINLLDTKPIHYTEETAVVSTYLNQTTINSNWKMCFIHTHHSSWQEIEIFTDKPMPTKIKVDRISTKVDLVLQNEEKFMISEGKENLQGLLRDPKIRKAIIWTSKTIDNYYNKTNVQFDAFIYNLLTVPDKEPEYYVSCEAKMVQGGIDKGHFDDIAYHKDYVIIIVYLDKNGNTAYKLIYSNNFDMKIKQILDKEFNQ